MTEAGNFSSTKMLHLSISTNRSEFPYQVRYPATMALVEFKVKLELVVGIYVADMKLELRSAEGKFLTELMGDDRTLEELGVRDGCIVHVRDLNTTNANGNCLNDSGSAQLRYVMPEEKYATRKDTARKWKQELLAAKSPTDSAENTQLKQEIPAHIRPGKRCIVQVRGQQPRRARIEFVGPTHFGQNPGSTQWVGVVYDEPVGKNDGSMDGHRYFQCEQAYGGFVQPRTIIETFDDNQQDAGKQVEMEMEEI